MHNIGVFTSICEEDAVWIPQYLREVDRLGVFFVMHFDRCSDHTKHAILSNNRCVGYTEQNDQTVEFHEMQKQGVFDKLVNMRYKWAMAWDIDETYEREAKRKLRLLTRRTEDALVTWWYNLWGDINHIRVDGHFSTGYRVKFYNLSRSPWTFESKITNGAKLSRPIAYHRSDLVCLHHGMMTDELRRMHKTRWDRIYTTALRGDPNPYGFWKDAINIPAQVVKHGY